MLEVKILLTELGQELDFEVDAVTAKGNNNWIGIMIGRLNSKATNRTIENLAG